MWEIKFSAEVTQFEKIEFLAPANDNEFAA